MSEMWHLVWTRGQFHQKIIAGCEYFSDETIFFTCPAKCYNASISFSVKESQPAIIIIIIIIIFGETGLRY